MRPASVTLFPAAGKMTIVGSVFLIPWIVVSDDTVTIVVPGYFVYCAGQVFHLSPVKRTRGLGLLASF